MNRGKPAMTLALAMLAWSAPGHSAPLRVEITAGLPAPLRIAVPALRSGVLEGVADGGDAGEAVAAIMRADLVGSGAFIAVEAPPAAKPARRGPSTPAALLRYRKAGAQQVLAGWPQLMPDGTAMLRCALHDVFDRSKLAEQRFVAERGQWRRLAHQCADFAYQQATGEPGHFDTRIAFVAEAGQAPGPRPGHAIIADLDGAGLRTLKAGDDLIAFPRLSPDGRRLALVRIGLAAARLDLFDLQSGASRTIALPPGTPVGPRFSPQGDALILAIADEEGSALYRYAIAPGTLERIGGPAMFDTAPDLSPDGRRIVFESARSGTSQLYVMDAGGSKPVRITFGEGSAGSPVWSPRGDRIAFTRIRQGQMRIATIRPDGAGERAITDGHQDEAPAWAPGGRQILFQRKANGGGPAQLWITDPSGRRQRRLPAGFAGADPSWAGARP